MSIGSGVDLVVGSAVNSAVIEPASTGASRVYSVINSSSIDFAVLDSSNIGSSGVECSCAGAFSIDSPRY